tara:strand:+ start:2902 stop:3135 length:234 start_codon:yes stop_codon:yes gene_type:complete
MQVEKVRLGDVNRVIDSQIESLTELAKTWQEEEIKAINDNDKAIQLYYNGRAMSTLHAIKRLEQVKASLEQRKISDI